MRATGIFLALLLRASAAFAQSQCQTCTCDGCLATLDPSAHYAISQTADASASAACFSWPGMSTTTYLGPTTTTVTVTRNVTVGTTTSTTTTVPSTQTVFGTVTSTYTSTEVVQTTQNPTTTVQTTSTSLVYSYIGTKSFYKRQSVSGQSSYVAPVPSAYSPYCSGDVAFLSACQCIGVTQTTFTSSGLTATATVTVNQTVVGNTEVDTSTVYSPVVVSQTSTARSTVVTTTSSTAVSTVTTYSVSDIVSTTTVSTSVATAAAPTGYLRVAQSGSQYDGYYLTNIASPNYGGTIVEMNLTSHGPYASQFSLVPNENGTSNLVGIDQINGSTYMMVHEREYADTGAGWNLQNMFHQLFYVPVEGFNVEVWDYVGCEDDDSPSGPLSCHSYPGDPTANPNNLYSGTIFQMCPSDNWNSTGAEFGDLILTDVPAPNCTTITFEWIDDAIEAGSPLYQGAVYRLDTDPSSYNYGTTGYFWTPPVPGSDRWNATMYLGADKGPFGVHWFQEVSSNFAGDGCRFNYIAPGEVYAAALNNSITGYFADDFAPAMEDFPGNFTTLHCDNPFDYMWDEPWQPSSPVMPYLLWLPIGGYFGQNYGDNPFQAGANTTLIDGSAELYDHGFGNLVVQMPLYGPTSRWTNGNVNDMYSYTTTLNQVINTTYWSDGHVEFFAGYSEVDTYVHYKNIPKICAALYGVDADVLRPQDEVAAEFPYAPNLPVPYSGYGSDTWGNGSMFAWDVAFDEVWDPTVYDGPPSGPMIIDTDQTVINHPELECSQLKVYWSPQLPTEAEIAAAMAAPYQVLTPSYIEPLP